MSHAVTKIHRVLITGAGSGIGAGIAGILARRGHEIIVSDISAKDADAVAKSIVAEGGKAESLVLDVGSSAAIDAAISNLAQPVDVLINNAGLQHVSRIEDFPPEKFQQLLNVMLFGASMLTRACLPSMRSQGYGRIINIGSIHALVASPFKSAYVAAKHGLIGKPVAIFLVLFRRASLICISGFSKAVALETGDVDITINTICPAYVRTPLVDKQIRDTVFPLLSLTTPTCCKMIVLGGHCLVP
jgi:3-hydroxybutyrate dehydrogenase